MRKKNFIKLYVFSCGSFFLLFNSLIISTIVYTVTAIILMDMLFRSTTGKMLKFLYLLTFSFVLAIQLNYTVFLAVSRSILIEDYIINKVISVLLLLSPFFIEQYFQVSNYQKYHFPNANVPNTISIAQINELSHYLQSLTDTLDKTTKVLTKDTVKDLLKEVTRNNSFSYITNDTLTDTYFKEAYHSLDDSHVYIVISDTGSNGSEFLSLFTSKSYNHASISFDRSLKTLVSYNGGEKVCPPGLNPEIVEYFQKKPDSSILVYKLAISRDAKKKLIDKVAQINTEGSAYNFLGLLLKQSYQPNIMFCSQFVYSLLKYGDVNYFERPDGDVRPTDLIELDYYRKLTFDYEIKFAS